MIRTKWGKDMKFEKYYEAREKVIEIMRKDLLGPLSDDEIICDERPLDYYITGKLYPQKNSTEVVAMTSADDVGNLDSEAQDQISLCNGSNPSSVGISFTLLPHVTDIDITVKIAYYTEILREEADKKLRFSDTGKRYDDEALFWRRNPKEYKTPTSIDITKMAPSERLVQQVLTNLDLRILLHKIYDDGSKTFTVSLVNNHLSSGDYIQQSVLSFFQPEIEITSSCEMPVFADVRKNVVLNEDAEVKELNMLYSKVRSFASGHGCAVTWETDTQGNATQLRIEFLPENEIRQMKPMAAFKNDVLSMRYISEASSKDIALRLRELTQMYYEWIQTQEIHATELDTRYEESAKLNIFKCKSTLNRLMKAIDIIESDPVVYKAFALANKAMFMQRKKMLVNTNRYTCDGDIKWYPFQLTFFLQETISFADPESDERKTVDLLWFPTGGGKTEAYLGIAAFTIFLRRLRYGENSDGVTVLMRYTLRLLSFQQFERAAALVFACEIIRKDQGILGGEIGIGLWAGRSLTPNKIHDAEKIISGEKDPLTPSSNPAQIKRCPWCDAEITTDNYSCNEVAKRMTVKCSNSSCEFNSGMPLYLIDEEIYKYAPTYIVATVDKFAQIALNEKTGVLLGRGNNKMPPELIIQDELHLISGPLGTITGIYEAAIKKLCEFNGRYPKVVASTATIRNAKEQIRALYAAEYTQFPPQGINIDDSFFAEISEREDKPARKYLGCMAVGTSPTTMFIRTMASLLFATRYLTELGYEDRVVDSFWTLTGYFNALRELGGAIVRVVDDIQDRFSYLRKGKFPELYPLTKGQQRYERYKELTSRESGETIGNVIQLELKIPYSTTEETFPYDFLLASNMISVGVDIGRLGTMVVVGQPKSTAEYIQATSRVGRETPGLVIATYNQGKSRDRSHYEQFTQYHESYYKHVEATSLTPFSDRARDRALQALYVILCRHTIVQLRDNESALNFKQTMVELQPIEDYILNYVKLVDPDELNSVRNEIIEIKAKWELEASRAKIAGKPFKYHAYKKTQDILFDPDYKENSRFRVLNSMRSVETTVHVYTEE